MLLLSLSLTAVQAGDLDIHFQVDDRIHTLQLTDIPSCAPTRVELGGEDSWSVRAMASAIDEEGTIYVTLELEAELDMGRHTRKVRTHPKFLTRDGEPATLTVGDAEGEVVVEVVATNFDLNTRCGPAGRDRHDHDRTRRSREIH